MIVKHPSNVTKSNNMYGKIKEHLEHELAEIKAAGLYKNERIIESRSVPRSRSADVRC